MSWRQDLANLVRGAATTQCRGQPPLEEVGEEPGRFGELINDAPGSQIEEWRDAIVGLRVARASALPGGRPRCAAGPGPHGAGACKQRPGVGTFTGLDCFFSFFFQLVVTDG